jgi:hypothetical protein
MKCSKLITKFRLFRVEAVIRVAKSLRFLQIGDPGRQINDVQCGAIIVIVFLK